MTKTLIGKSPQMTTEASGRIADAEIEAFLAECRADQPNHEPNEYWPACERCGLPTLPAQLGEQAYGFCPTCLVRWHIGNLFSSGGDDRMVRAGLARCEEMPSHDA
jgi:hypothetical protein